MKSADWYFDFVSPFSYFQSRRLKDLMSRVELRARPVLFGAVLNHWGTIGPAELAPKRLWTYQHCLWRAHRQAIPFRMPREHPFNPLPLLRLALVFGQDGVVPLAILDRLFEYVWIEGHLPGDADPWAALLQALEVRPDQLEAAEVKAQLRANGERALAAGVFGVPATVCDGQQFWGDDATEMLVGWLEGDVLFASEAYRSLADLPVGVERRRS